MMMVAKRDLDFYLSSISVSLLLHKRDGLYKLTKQQDINTVIRELLFNAEKDINVS